MDPIPFYTDARLKQLRAAANNWINATGINWDTAACWHLPLNEVAKNVEHAEIHVGKRLRIYFNKLDRRLFKNRLKHGSRVKRFITLEHSAGIGWHVHGILASPTHMDQLAFIGEVEQVWFHFVQREKICLPRERLTWCEPIADRYPQYITKNSFAPSHRAKGTIDILNTYFGELPN